MISGIKKVAIRRKIIGFLAERRELQPQTIRSVGLILDTDDYPESRNFLDLKNSLSAEELVIVEFSNSKKKASEEDDFTFTPANIGVSGVIKKESIKAFSEKEYDLLINYTKRSLNAFNLLAAASKARFKVGINNENEAFYDLILEMKIEDVEGFKTELIKYLKILKLLKNE